MCTLHAGVIGMNVQFALELPVLATYLIREYYRVKKTNLVSLWILFCK